MVLTCPSLGDGQIVSMNAAVNPEPRGIIVVVAADSLEERLRAYSTRTTHTNRWVQVYLLVRILRIPLCCSIPHEISGCLEAIIPTAYVDRKALDTHIGSLRELSLVSADILNTTNPHLASYNPVGTNVRLIWGLCRIAGITLPIAIFILLSRVGHVYTIVFEVPVASPAIVIRIAYGPRWIVSGFGPELAGQRTLVGR